MFRSQSLTPVVLLLLLTACATLVRDPSWRDARRDSSAQAPDPATTPEAVIQVYAARTVGVKGVLGVHTWVASAIRCAEIHAVRGHRLGRRSR